MGTQRYTYKKKKLPKSNEQTYTIFSLSKNEFQQFNEDLLELGEISRDAKIVNSLTAIFDLAGFTDFCNQIDSQLVIPEYLDSFIKWLFEEIRNQFKYSEDEEDVILWESLPFFGKFMGDGILFLWDTDLCLGSEGIGNIVVSLQEVCSHYQRDFLPNALEEYAKVPQKLRLGIARGQVYSIGEGKDYVGPCINMAARLQKIASLSFAISRRGFDPRKCFAEEIQVGHIMKQISIRGIGTTETIIILKNEFDLLSPEEKEMFK